eukprot:TRINITY_DN1798_c0_g1_i5.p2 TRINITY_DN1798_c0_g1~~TRINITY_DN1798_c0_g1_i5.p2  ORF type:complete len:227 (+),score=65.16 TRINITY_DN1798_c0_g1_i5:72-752(+)
MEASQDKKSFGHENLINLLKRLLETKDDMDIDAFTGVLLEFMNMFSHMGSVMSFAFSDITTKCAIIQTHKKNYQDKINGLMSLIELEVKMNVQMLNGENNSDFTKDPALKKYESATRNILRMMWFLDYEDELFAQLLANKEEKDMTPPCKAAYEKALAPRHAMLVRAAARVAMSAAPNKEKGFKQLWGDRTLPEIYDLIEKTLAVLRPVRERLWTYYTERKLDKLP